ncbi:hypothetical protein ES703_99132 [subsurface metagenome]
MNVKLSYFFKVVAVEIEPDGGLHIHRIAIDDTSPQGKGARLDNQGSRIIAVVREPGAQIGICYSAGPDLQGGLPDRAGRGNTLGKNSLSK